MSINRISPNNRSAHKGNAKVKTPNSFSDMIQKKTGQISAPEQELRGASFYDDERFALDIERFIQMSQQPSVKIRTDQPINWLATGEHILTPEEAARLKEKYDITNLAPQEFYYMMADLTSLNVISASEAISHFYFESEYPDLPSAGPDYPNGVAVSFTGQICEYSSFRGLPITDFLKVVQDGRDYFSIGVQYVESQSFYRDNKDLFDRHPDLWEKLRTGFQKGYDEYRRLYSIFGQLARDGVELTEEPAYLPEDASVQETEAASTQEPFDFRERKKPVTLSAEMMAELFGKYIKSKEELLNDPMADYFHD